MGNAPGIDRLPPTERWRGLVALGAVFALVVGTIHLPTAVMGRWLLQAVIEASSICLLALALRASPSARPQLWLLGVAGLATVLLWSLSSWAAVSPFPALGVVIAVGLLVLLDATFGRRVLLVADVGPRCISLALGVTFVALLLVAELAAPRLAPQWAGAVEPGIWRTSARYGVRLAAALLLAYGWMRAQGEVSIPVKRPWSKVLPWSALLTAMMVIVVLALRWEAARRAFAEMSEVRALFECLDLRELANARWTVKAVVPAVLIGPVAEELIHRRLLYRMLRDLVGVPWFAMLLSGLAFGYLHLSYGVGFLMGYVVGGAGLAWAYERTGRLAVPIGLHAAYNLAVVVLRPHLIEQTLC